MHQIVGFEEGLCALLTEPEAAYGFLSAIADYRVKLIRKISRYHRPDALCFHDDYGSNDRLLMSVNTWREIIKPHLKRVIDAVHEEGMFYEHHSCGYVAPLFPDFVELGMDAINPVQMNNNPISIKKEFGANICIVGGFNNQGLFDNPNSTYDEVYNHSLDTIKALAPGGSYIVNAAGMLPLPNTRVLNQALRDALEFYTQQTKR